MADINLNQVSVHPFAQSKTHELFYALACRFNKLVFCEEQLKTKSNPKISFVSRPFPQQTLQYALHCTE